MNNAILMNLTGVVVYLLGLATGYWLSGRDKQAQATPKKPDPEESTEILVKRNRPSFRHPGRTSVSSYDPYKQSNGLYATVRPGKGSSAEEVDKK